MILEPINILFRLVAATFIGGMLGIDREVHAKPAGVRTHALVCLGAATIIICVLQFSRGSVQFGDAMSRAVQGIIAGVGFLGGGTILKSREGDAVHGLTTAASIWVAAALGVACGGGYWSTAIASLALAVAILVLGAPVEGWLRRIFRVPPANP